jgi:hypothetical protein
VAAAAVVGKASLHREAITMLLEVLAEEEQVKTILETTELMAL